MNESRAVAAYLASKYGKEGASLYPGDAETRVRVDQRLYFDMGTFYKVRRHLLVYNLLLLTTVMQEVLVVSDYCIDGGT